MMNPRSYYKSHTGKLSSGRVLFMSKPESTSCYDFLSARLALEYRSLHFRTNRTTTPGSEPRRSGLI